MFPWRQWHGLHAYSRTSRGEGLAILLAEAPFQVKIVLSNLGSSGGTVGASVWRPGEF